MKILRPLKAIRAKCIDCCGGSAREVRFCEIETCPLFPYRFGKKPRRAEKMPVFSKKTQIYNYSDFETGRGAVPTSSRDMFEAKTQRSFDFHSKITGILIRKAGINHGAPDAK